MFPCALKGLPSGRQVRLDSTDDHDDDEDEDEHEDEHEHEDEDADDDDHDDDHHDDDDHDDDDDDDYYYDTETSPAAGVQGIFRQPLDLDRPPSIDCNKAEILRHGGRYRGMFCCWTSGFV